MENMKKVAIQPLEDFVVLKKSLAPETTAGGIVLPQTVQQNDGRGEVQAVGPGRLLENGERVKMQVSVGDTVLFPSFAGQEIKHEGQDLLLIRERDILARIK